MFDLCGPKCCADTLDTCNPYPHILCPSDLGNAPEKLKPSMKTNPVIEKRSNTDKILNTVAIVSVFAGFIGLALAASCLHSKHYIVAGITASAGVILIGTGFAIPIYHNRMKDKEEYEAYRTTPGSGYGTDQ